MTYKGWFRCRITGRRNKYPWIYFEVGPMTNKRKWRQEARYRATLHLKRQVFDFEACHPPEWPVPMPGCEGYFMDSEV